MEACKLQRPHSQHCGTTTKVFAKMTGVVISLHIHWMMDNTHSVPWPRLYTPGTML